MGRISKGGLVTAVEDMDGTMMDCGEEGAGAGRRMVETDGKGAVKHSKKMRLLLCVPFLVRATVITETGYFADQDLPPIFFSENSGGIAISQYLENLGGDMARPRIKNLTSPIFDIAPPQRISESWPKLSRPWEDFQTLPQWNR